ncbi:hypothetical protein LSCM1_01541 [Leishmania martiniquensis]|uniref:Enoyl-CoA delta isomerase 1, mitochondrial n=1 Tax=Leishmania martiniquensis TaxID=1580590 RepID=A0A836GPB9_9TRYP|nr:hypothetical protein LSCM1_01541 [Leishmania martiniquensis]
MRRVISSSLARCAGTVCVTSALLQLPQRRFQSQAPPGAPQQGGAVQEHGQDGRPIFRSLKKPTEVPKLVKINTTDKGITNVQLARAPVNSLSLELLKEINQWMLWLGSNEETKAVVISSAIPTVFSGGLEFSEVHNPKPERISLFWQSFQEMWLILNSFPKPIIAAINGNSPAAGCIIAMGCDYRVMARGPKDNQNNSRLYRIGLNESKLGLVAPPWTVPAYCCLMGPRQAERMLQLGETPVADDALKLGLIDEVTPDDERTVEVAYQQAERFLTVPQQSRQEARDLVRGEYLELLSSEEKRQYDVEVFKKMVQSPEAQKNLETYLQRLKSRSRK